MAIKVTINNNGPIRIEGDPADFSIHDAQGAAFGLAGRSVISLCRCGLSANKPFCDATQAKVGFQAAETAPKKP